MSIPTPTTTTLSASTSLATSSAASCTTAVPGKYGAVPPDACNSNYNYSPNFAAAVAMSTLFGVVFLGHLIQAVAYKKRYAWVLLMMVLWETLSFILRAIGAHNQQNLGYVIGYTLLFLLAPLWINAFAYMTVARLIHYLIPEKRVYGIKASSITKYYVWADIISFIVQAAGGTMLSGNPSVNVLKIGMDVYRAGIGLQECFILTFLFVTAKFHREMLSRDRNGLVDRSIKWRALTWTIYAVLILITVRIVYRIVEFSDGLSLNNPILTHEFYSYVFDALPMILAAILLNVVHPGMVLKGPESEFPHLSRKERKMLKQEEKAAKQQRKHEKRSAKEQRKWERQNPRRVPAAGNEGGLEMAEAVV